MICDQLGEEPDPAKMPLDASDFPGEVQVAFFMFSLLPDYWEGMSGTYMGKHWDGLGYFLDLYEVEDKRTVLYLMKLYEREIIEYRAEKQEQKRKAEERKSKAGGKNFTHNVKG